MPSDYGKAGPEAMSLKAYKLIADKAASSAIQRLSRSGTRRGGNSPHRSRR